MPGIFSPGGGKPPIDVINLFSESAANRTMSTATSHEILTGSLTADTYSTILEITSGGGVITALAVIAKDATARTLTPRVTIDGTEVFEQVSDTLNASGEGVIVVGSFDGTYLQETGGVLWASSLKIEVDSSVTETDKSSILVSYYLT